LSRVPAITSAIACCTIIVARPRPQRPTKNPGSLPGFESFNASQRPCACLDSNLRRLARSPPIKSDVREMLAHPASTYSIRLRQVKRISVAGDASSVFPLGRQSLPPQTIQPPRRTPAEGFPAPIPEEFAATPDRAG